MTTTIFDYWLSENAVHHNWVFNRLRSEGIDGHTDGDFITFQSDADTPLARFLDGRKYNYITWVEEGATLDEPAPEPEVQVEKRKGRPKKTEEVVVTPEPVVEAPVVEPTPEPVVVPEVVVEPVVTPEVAPATPVVEEKTDVASTTVSEEPKPVDGEVASAA